ncbi:DUF973 family protein [Saccharolobus solfataricus]|uniref:DUF973 family protein n=3 Tax=Saccharolobus solfataricus TaxID=2287 RepID=Q97YW6_SACS2|nr:DUF973 family protein [Saccharolobus solfataricus]AAK41434.1 Hypothetical protein SSO1185 [Saccharolobus solfataricus P2]AKA74372.1 DUF973 family protein [Saccharolobus solfataricus]AKA77068.1 DUF973 family protein [Saccharolobus solfataricus]AKA79760.1 DUF973 family protein [Saccharolobus solfataricus]AZF68854.1 DUF973 family protein [Saccharolobus solfataricus]
MNYTEAEYKGLSYLRRGNIEIIIIILIELIAILLTYIMQSLGLPNPLQDFLILLPSSAISALLVILAYLDIQRGLSNLAKAEINIGINNVISFLFLVLSILAIIGVVSYTLSLVLTSVTSSILASLQTLLEIFAFITLILLGFSYKLIGDHYSNNYLSIGGLVLILGVILFIFKLEYGGLLAFIGLIITYIGLTNLLTIKKPVSPPPPPLQTPSAPSETTSSTPSAETTSTPPTVNIISHGGILRSNGEAFIAVSSDIEDQILSSTILNTDYSTNEITPKTLSKGYNSIKIKFNINPQQFTSGNNYTIRLVLASGKNIDVTTFFQP